MTLPASGISMGAVNTELGLSSTALITLNDAAVRRLMGPVNVPDLGTLRNKTRWVMTAAAQGSNVGFSNGNQQFSFVPNFAYGALNQPQNDGRFSIGNIGSTASPTPNFWLMCYTDTLPYPSQVTVGNASIGYHTYLPSVGVNFSNQDAGHKVLQWSAISLFNPGDQIEIFLT